MRVPEQLSGSPILQYGVDLGRCEIGSTDLRRYVAICRSADPLGYLVHSCDRDWQVMESEFFPAYETATQRAVELAEGSFDWQFPDLPVWNWILLAERGMYGALAVLVTSTLGQLTVRYASWPTRLMVPDSADWLVIARMLAVLSAIACVALAISVVAIWLLVGYFAFQVGSWKYGIGHLIIVVFFTPVFLLGPILVPRMVARDVLRWREADELKRCGAPADSADSVV
ncbi:MAG: hypothetical protein U0795_13970 [Pirellulales bacterium]